MQLTDAEIKAILQREKKRRLMKQRRKRRRALFFLFLAIVVLLIAVLKPAVRVSERNEKASSKNEGIHKRKNGAASGITT